MLIKYAYKAGATVPNMAADMAKLLSGVAIADLSADCDKATTQIIANSIPSNWTVVDLISTNDSTGSAVIRSLNADGVTYKYVQIGPSMDNNATTTVAYATGLTVYEDWNTSTHIGVNQAIHYSKATCFPVGRYSTGYSVIGGTSRPLNAGTIMLYATNRCVIVDGVYAGEYSRDSASIDGSYPCVCVFPLEEAASVWGQIGSTSPPKTNSTIGACRYNTFNGDNYVGAPWGGYNVQLFDVKPAKVNKVSKTAKYRTPAEVEFLYGSPLYFIGYIGIYGSGGRHVTLGKIYDLVVSTSGGLSISFYDEVQFDGQTYIYVGAAPGNIWVKKG